MRRPLTLFLTFTALGVASLVLLGTRAAGLPPLAALLDPVDGLYRTARLADHPPASEVRIAGLSDSIRVVWDDRRVPHIFAAEPLDAVAALGYVHARDRLFQMDFIPRAASGRLSEALGGAAIGADKFLRRTGMDWGAKMNLERIERVAGIELAILRAYCRGVNAFVEGLGERDLPFEFRLLGYEPDSCTSMQPMRVLQYMNYDLSYGTDQAAYGWLRQRLSDADYELLYPLNPDYSVPIIPPATSPGTGSGSMASRSAGGARGVGPILDPRTTDLSPLLEGYLPGKGSNNWAVAGSRSATGSPTLAGDMHLAVSLPAIWYEAHIVTPETNVYGVSIPGAPVIVEAFNDHVAWAFTNTGSDQIDHYLMQLDSTETRYRFDGTWRELDLVVDTIHVAGGTPILDTLRYSHWGPVVKHGGEWIAEQWVAHDSSRTLLALWKMMQSRSHGEFQDALRYWDTPMQNILYADTEGTISIRSTGYLPIRRGGSGAGLLDGTSTAGEWVGRVPFEELPYAENPDRGYLTSTNQKPTDSSYAHYLGHAWGDKTYRSIRIDTLLRRKAAHSVDDLQSYQSDVHAVQRDFFVPLIDTLSGLDGRAAELRAMLVGWDGRTTLDRREPLALHYFLDELERLTWDEDEFAAVRLDAEGDTLSSPYRVPRPAQTRLYHLLAEYPDSPWLNVESTLPSESADDLLRRALAGAASRLESRYGWISDAWRWQERHGIRFNHLIGALEALGRGPMPYPGYDDTLSPAADTLATHSASWRVIVDFSTSPPTAKGIYPGGQSGNPFSRFYDLQLPAYVNFEYYDLLKPASAMDLGSARTQYATLMSPQD